MKRGLNVGSGQRPFTSVFDQVHWVNVDSQARWNADLTCDGVNLPFADETVDYFVLHHVLEHFGCGEAEGLINEAFRVLKPEGSLIVCVPDMLALVSGWLSRKISTQIFMTNVYGAYMGSDDDRHKWGFDAITLSVFLSGERKWRLVTSFDFRPIPGANIAQDWWILGMECIK